MEERRRINTIFDITWLVCNCCFIMSLHLLDRKSLVDNNWWCLESLKVYLVLDIPVSVMYCIYRLPGPSIPTYRVRFSDIYF